MRIGRLLTILSVFVFALGLLTVSFVTALEQQDGAAPSTPPAKPQRDLTTEAMAEIRAAEEAASEAAQMAAQTAVQAADEMPLLQATKSAASLDSSYKVGPLFALTGAPITYTIVVTNSGDVTATNGVLTDTIPLGTLYITGSLACNTGVCSYDGSAISWHGNLAPAEGATITFAIMAGARCGRSIDNVAYVSADGVGAVTLMWQTAVWDNLVYFSDFEVDNGGLITGTDGVISGMGDWEWGVPSFPVGLGAVSGNNVWATILDGSYTNNDVSGSSLLTLTVDVTEMKDEALSWWQYLQAGGSTFDYASVRVNGSSIYDSRLTGDDDVYTLYRLDMSAYVTNTAEIVFDFFATTVVNDDGWYLDDLAVYSCDLLPYDIALDKRVGTEKSSCATTDEITIEDGDTAVYCYEVTNTGTMTVSLHDLEDSELGTLLSGSDFDLAPNASWWITAAVVLTETTVNTATWTAYNVGPTNVVSATDTAIVNVAPSADYPVCVGFEDGSLPNFMSVAVTSDGAANGRVHVTTDYPADGNYALDIDTDCDGCGGQTQQAAILSVNLAGQSDVVLLLSVFEHGDEDHPEDGIFISDDGGFTWAQILSLNGFPATYEDVVLPLDTAVANAGMSFVDGFLIRFQSLDNFSIPLDGYSFDNICVQPAAPAIDVVPDVVSSTQFVDVNSSNSLDIVNVGSLTLTWNFDDVPSGCDDYSTISWLTLTPVTGSVEVLDSMPVQVDIDSTNLGFGSYGANLCVASNDPIRPLVPVTISLEVVPREADIVVAPTALMVDQFQDVVTNNTLQIINAGSFTLTWNVEEAPLACQKPSDVPWLTMVPASGDIGVADSVNARVDIDSSGLSLGSYEAQLCITSNDPDEPLLIVPVALEVVTLAPNIVVEPTALEFSQFKDVVATDEIEIINDGSLTLTWRIEEAPAVRPPVWEAPVERRQMRLERMPVAVASHSIPTGGIVADGGFEGGTPNAFWNEASANFSTPICNLLLCGIDGARSGEYWAWFGGIADVTEIASVDQAVTIPTNTVTTTLNFWLQIAAWGTPGVMNVEMDGNPIFTVTEVMSASYQTYTEVVLDISEYADGGSHTLAFVAVTQATAGAFTSFFVDDVAVLGDFDCEILDDVSWLAVAPITGTTGISDTSSVAVTVDSGGLDTGAYHADLCIHSDDPDQPITTMPISLTVNASPPNIDVAPKTLNGRSIVGDVVSVTMVINNSGQTDLSWMMGELADTVAPTIDHNSPEAQLAREIAWAQAPVFAPNGSDFDCMAYKNYTGAEPIGFAENCLVQVDKGDGPTRLYSPTDIAFAHDVGFVSDNVVEFALNDFSGQTVIGTNVQQLFGYDYDPTGTILYAVNNETSEFGTFQITSSTFISIGIMPQDGGGETWTSLAIDPINGNVYASATDAGQSYLYLIDPDDGGTAFIGEVDVAALIALAVAPNGVLYGHDIDTDAIYTIDTDTGEATLVGPTGFDGVFAQDMDFDNEDGTLYIFLYTGSGTNVFGVVDLTTGAVTPLAQDDPLGEFEGAIPTVVSNELCDDDVAWLSASPNQGTVAPNGSMTVTVVMDSTGLDTGVYRSKLCVNSNDPFQEQVLVPVTLTVAITTNVQLVHLAPTEPDDAAVDIYLNGTLAFADFVYAESSGYMAMPAGAYDVEVKFAGTDSVIIAEDISLSNDSYNTVIAIGGINGYEATLMHLVDNAPSAVGPFGYLRIGHLAPFDSSIFDTAVHVINEIDNSTIVSNTSYGDVSMYLPLPAGVYDLRIELADDGTPLFNLAAFTLTAGQSIFAVAAGDDANQTLDVYGVFGDSGLLPSLLEPLNYLYAPVVFND